MAKAGAIPALVDLLIHGTWTGKAIAATALRTLGVNDENEVRTYSGNKMHQVQYCYWQCIHPNTFYLFFQSMRPSPYAHVLVD